jgi:hypothetical protein
MKSSGDFFLPPVCERDSFCQRRTRRRACHSCLRSQILILDMFNSQDSRGVANGSALQA